jgi:hypothetical protein
VLLLDRIETQHSVDRSTITLTVFFKRDFHAQISTLKSSYAKLASLLQSDPVVAQCGGQITVEYVIGTSQLLEEPEPPEQPTRVDKRTKSDSGTGLFSGLFS